MEDWTAGYTADVNYTYGYYPDLNPSKVKFMLITQGLAYPKIQTACELGYGQGLSTNIHASASGIKWEGTDFNPSQASFARELAGLSENQAVLTDHSFDEYLHSQKDNSYEFIALHGIWSWISDVNRKVIVEFLKNKLKPGGVCYISYNTLPGWSSFAPLRQLMSYHYENIGQKRGAVEQKISNAIAFVDKLLETNPRFTQQNPLSTNRFEKIKKENKEYLAHEYFNKDWNPMYFADLVDWLKPSKLEFGVTANFIDIVDVINLSIEQQGFMRSLDDFYLKQSVRDFLVNQQFRRDYWIKGARKLTKSEQVEELLKQRFVLRLPSSEFDYKVKGSLGNAELLKEHYEPIIDKLANDKYVSFKDLIKTGDFEIGTTLQAIAILLGKNTIELVQEDAEIENAVEKTERLNKALCRRSRDVDDIQFLSSPVTGGGIHVNRIFQLFLLAYESSGNNIDELVNFAWRCVHSNGQRLLEEGKELKTEEENKKFLEERAFSFINKHLPILKALGIAKSN